MTDKLVFLQEMGEGNFLDLQFFLDFVLMSFGELMMLLK